MATAFRTLVIVGVILALVGLSAPAHAQDPCAGLVASRLETGGAARVSAAYGVSLKNKPMTGAAGATEVSLMAYGTVVTVLEGPRCNLGYRWWQVQLPGGATGWAAEGNTADYFMEPLTVGLDVYQRRAEGGELARYFITPDGAPQPRDVFRVVPFSGTPGAAWQQVEIDRLGALLDDARANCPDRLMDTPFATAYTLEAALNLPLPPLDYDIYPSPDGAQMVLVRHLRLDVPRCDTVLREPVGVSRVSVLAADGSETLLFPYPQHGTVPDSTDVYTGGDPSLLNVYFEEVVWSPQGKYIAFSTAYRYACNRQNCYRFHLYVHNQETGQLYVLGEGRHPGWTNGGEGINFFRLIRDANDNAVAHLYTARPDGSNRQEVWLPGGADYVSPKQTPFGYPWNASGTRVMVQNRGGGEIMLFNLADRTFTPVMHIPDKMPLDNRLSVNLIKGESAYLWTTIRGEFALQDAKTGQWAELQSTVSTTGVPVTQVRAFATGNRALVEMADHSAYILNVDADTLTPIAFVN